MILAPMFLWRAAEGHPVGDAWPYRGGTQADIHDHLRQVAEALAQGPLLYGEPDFDMLLDESIRSALVYCTKRALRLTAEEGVAVFLSSIAPLAAFCPMTVRRSQRDTARTLHAPNAGQWPPGDWEAESRWLTETLEGFGFVVPGWEELSATLSDSDEIPQVLRGQTQFNAIFF